MELFIPNFIAPNTSRLDWLFNMPLKCVAHKSEQMLL